jgi:GntR family transcriptional regulator, arabinose operon transcriptional repressor
MQQMASKHSQSGALAMSEVKVRDTKYRKVLDHLYAEIHSGRMQPGMPLPTDLDLSTSLGMSRNTVRHAFDKLVQEGVVYRVPGRGTFVTTDQQRQSRQQLDLYALIAPQLREGFYPSLVHGFEQACAGFQHQVVVSNSGNDVKSQGDLVLQMLDRSVGGVAIVPTTADVTPTYQVRQLQEHHIPVVFCHRTVAGISAPCVTWSGREVGRKAAAPLIEVGHRRLGFLIKHASSLALDYENGLRQALNQLSGEECEVVSVDYGQRVSSTGEQAPAAIRSALTELFARPNRPTAIFCGNLTDAEQVYLQAESFGLKIPRDLSLIYFGGSWREHGLAQSISCVAVSEHEVGARAAQLLHEMRSGTRPLDDDERFEFPVSLLPGETIGAAPQTPGSAARG